MSPQPRRPRSVLIVWIAGGAIVFVTSFWFSSMLFDSSGGDPAEIQIIEATYGLNCKDRVQNGVTAGNATALVAAACNQKSGTCRFAIDEKQLGDPAPACAKDFYIRWRCGSAPAEHDNTVGGEAHGNTVTIACASQQ